MLPLVFLLCLNLVTRLFNLTLLPIFTDESIYIFWAKTIQTTGSNWFISLYDGKPPLFIWSIATALSVFPSSSYLLAGRLVSVLASLLTITAIYKISFHLFNHKRIAVIASLFYIISPLTLLYDRLALFESLFTAMLVWSVYFMLKNKPLLWGLFLGLSLLTKPPAILFVILTPLCFFILNHKKAFLPPLIALLLYSSLLVSTNFKTMLFKNQQFQLPLAQFVKNPFQLFSTNIPLIYNWLTSYYSLPVLLLGLLAFAYMLHRKPKIGLVFLSLWLVPLLAFAFLGRQLFPRYIVFITPYFVIPLAFMLRKFPILLIVFVLQIRLNYFLLTNPPQAKLPSADYEQLISSYPSGYGLDQIFSFLDQELNQHQVTLVTQGTFGLYPYAFKLRYWDNPHLTLVTRENLDQIDPQLYNLKGDHTYLVFSKYQYIPGHLLLKQIIKAEKPRGEKYPIYLTTFL